MSTTYVSGKPEDGDAAITADIAREPTLAAAALATSHPAEPATSIRRALWVLVFLAIGFTLYVTSTLILQIIVAVTLALLLSPLVSWLKRFGLPRAASAAVVVVTVLIGLGALSTQVASPLQRWIETAPDHLRKLEGRVSALMRPVEAVREATEKVSEIGTSDDKPKPREVVVQRSGASVLNVTTDTVVTVLSTILLVYFLLACGDVLLRKLVAITPDREDKMRIVEIFRTIQREVGLYFGTITLVNMGLGVATGLMMWALGMPTPVVWGVAIALLNFLPYLGPGLFTVTLAAVAVITFDTPFEMLAPPAAFLLLNFIEDHLVMPFVLGRKFAINPVVIFVWVLVWAWMWGIGGLLIAVPLLVALRICAERIPRLQPLAVMLSRS